jgi:hypothetical protein
VPPEWIDGLDRLREMACPPTVRPADWRAIIAAAGPLLRSWGATLARMGWTTLDLFGAHPECPQARYDCAGLVLFLPGHNVTDATAEAVTLSTRTGATHTFRRPNVPYQRVALWELAN